MTDIKQDVLNHLFLIFIIFLKKQNLILFFYFNYLHLFLICLYNLLNFNFIEWIFLTSNHNSCIMKARESIAVNQRLRVQSGIFLADVDERHKQPLPLFESDISIKLPKKESLSRFVKWQIIK